MAVLTNFLDLYFQNSILQQALGALPGGVRLPRIIGNWCETIELYFLFC